MKIETATTLPFRGKITFEDFQQKIQIFDFINTLMSLQKLSSFLSNQTGVNINIEFEFLVGPRVKHRILLPKDFISFLAKQCILKCASSVIKYNDLDLTNLVYEYGNMETDLDHTRADSKDAWLWVLRATNHQWFYLRLPSSVMGRFIYLFEKVFQAEPELKQKIDAILELEFYNIPLFSKAQLIREQTYKDGKNEVKSADWLLASEKYIFQIECKKRKLDNYSRAGIEDEDKTGIESFIANIAKELDKFPKKEQHIKDGKVDKIKYEGQTFINIIVYLDEMFALNQYAREEIKSKMKEDADNFYILGCYEFEMLCQHANNKNLNLKSSLDDLMAKRTEIYSIEFLDKVYHDFLIT